MKYIELTNAINAVNGAFKFEVERAENYRDIAVETLKLLPTVEVRQGHWVKVDDNLYEYVAMCSVCHNEVKQPTCMLKPIYSYCPICGARMVKEDG